MNDRIARLKKGGLHTAAFAELVIALEHIADWLHQTSRTGAPMPTGSAFAMKTCQRVLSDLDSELRDIPAIQKPATPLPWTDDFHNDPEPETRTPTFPISIIGEGKIVAQTFTGNKRAQQDVAYIVHACNAYPRMINMLRELVTLDEVIRGGNIQEEHRILNSARQSLEALEGWVKRA